MSLKTPNREAETESNSTQDITPVPFTVLEIAIIDTEAGTLLRKNTIAQNLKAEQGLTNWKKWLEYKQSGKYPYTGTDEYQYTRVMGNIIVLRTGRGFLARESGTVELWINSQELGSAKAAQPKELKLLIKQEIPESQ